VSRSLRAAHRTSYFSRLPMALLSFHSILFLVVLSPHVRQLCLLLTHTYRTPPVPLVFYLGVHKAL